MTVVVAAKFVCKSDCPLVRLVRYLMAKSSNRGLDGILTRHSYFRIRTQA